jgi:thioredoxin 1
MTKYIFSLLIGLTVFGLLSLKFNNTKFEEHSNGIIFEKTSWSEVLNKAKKDNKIIFLDVYASWCGPCKMLKKTTFSNEKVGAFYNEKFINIAVDAEVGEGIALAEKYHVTGFPTLLFIKPDGSVLTKSMGYHSPSDFLELGNLVLKK